MRDMALRAHKSIPGPLPPRPISPELAKPSRGRPVIITTGPMVSHAVVRAINLAMYVPRDNQVWEK